MSDGKEVKRWETISIDTKIPGTRPDVDGVPRVTVVSATDHDRIMAAKDAAYDSLDNVNMKLNEQVAELRVEVERLKEVRKRQTRMLMNAIGLRDETIATQARVIEIATRTMATVLEIEHCGETSCPLPMRAMCSNESHKVLRSALREIAAIEKEGEK